MSNTKLLVGLGNPGPRYANNRHNIGFQIIDLLAARHNIELGKLQARARFGTGWLRRGGERVKVMLAKPLTYMNASGEAVGQLMRYYRLDLDDLIVVHDHLDLEAGTLRIRPKGGAGGQNGMKSIIQHLGSEEFARVRVGIGRPPGRMDPAAYVLHNFSAGEEKLFDVVRETTCDALECWAFDGLDRAMNRYNAPVEA